MSKHIAAYSCAASTTTCSIAQCYKYKYVRRNFGRYITAGNVRKNSINKLQLWNWEPIYIYTKPENVTRATVEDWYEKLLLLSQSSMSLAINSSLSLTTDNTAQEMPTQLYNKLLPLTTEPLKIITIQENMLTSNARKKP